MERTAAGIDKRLDWSIVSYLRFRYLSLKVFTQTCDDSCNINQAALPLVNFLLLTPVYIQPSKQALLFKLAFISNSSTFLSLPSILNFLAMHELTPRISVRQSKATPRRCRNWPGVISHSIVFQLWFHTGLPKAVWGFFLLRSKPPPFPALLPMSPE